MKKIKDLPENTSIGEYKVKIPAAYLEHVPRRNYYYVYSITGFTTWLKTSRKSSRAYPIQMMLSTVLELKLYKEPKKKKK